jgi:hypothetical protein
MFKNWDAVVQLVEETALRAGRSRVRFPMGVTGIFHCYYPSGRNMALGSTQLLTVISPRNISFGLKKAGA